MARANNYIVPFFSDCEASIIFKIKCGYHR